MALEWTESEAAEGWKCLFCADLNTTLKYGCVPDDTTRSIRNCKKILTDKGSGS